MAILIRLSPGWTLYLTTPRFAGMPALATFAEPPVAAPPSPFVPFVLKPTTISAVRDGLWMVVNGAGTGRRAMVAGRDVAGKTGTAQVISLQGKERARGKTDQDLRDHGWFVFMAPKDNPEIAGVIFAEHGEHGYLGAPIARHVIETYFAKKEGMPLPALPKPLQPSTPVPDPDSQPVLPSAAVADARPSEQAIPVGDVRTTAVLPR